MSPRCSRVPAAPLHVPDADPLLQQRVEEEGSVEAGIDLAQHGIVGILRRHCAISEHDVECHVHQGVIAGGEQAYDPVLSMSDEAGQAWLKAHLARADQFIWFFYALAALSLAAMVAPPLLAVLYAYKARQARMQGPIL